MLCGLAVGKRLGMTRAQRVLSGGAVAICGASAALAISAVLPREKEGDRFTLMVVVTVTVMSTLAMVPVPPRGARAAPAARAGGPVPGRHDPRRRAGRRARATRSTTRRRHRHHREAVPRVAAHRRGGSSSRRVQALARACRCRERHPRPHAGEGRRSVPWFLWLFVGMVVLNSLGHGRAAGRPA
jgi:hypothetical protein